MRQRQRKDLTGLVSGRLTVIKYSHQRAWTSNDKIRRKHYWLCQCECGNRTTVDGEKLKNQHSQSCGCLAKEVSAAKARRFQPRARKDLTGQVFGRLTIIAFSHVGAYRAQFWLCRCQCGEEKAIDATSLKAGTTQSCGCLQRELQAAKKTKHGKCGTREYRIWSSMITRCHNPKAISWEWYGGRGITVCDRWRNSFENFYQDIGDIPEPLSIDRIDNDKGYEPGNVRLATPVEQNNNKRNNKG